MHTRPPLPERRLDRVVVHEATTDAEREAIYRFRYDVYVDELGKTVDGIDHHRRWLHDEDDDNPHAVLLYTGSPDAITGTLRIIVHAAAAPLAGLLERYTLDSFPGTAAVAESSRLMVAKERRGGSALAALARTAYRRIVAAQAYLTVAYCAPGLVSLYRRLGYRPYQQRLISTRDGLRVPLINVMCDASFYRDVRSPLLPDLQQAFPSGAPAGFDLASYTQVITDRGQHATDDPNVWQQLASALTDSAAQCCGTGRSSTPADVMAAAADGFLVHTLEQQIVTRTHRGNDDAFVVLDGSFEETTKHGRRINVWDRGDIVGATSTEDPTDHERTTIRSLTGGRLLVLKATVLRRLLGRHGQHCLATLR